MQLVKRHPIVLAGMLLYCAFNNILTILNIRIIMNPKERLPKNVRADMDGKDTTGSKIDTSADIFFRKN